MFVFPEHCNVFLLSVKLTNIKYPDFILVIASVDIPFVQPFLFFGVVKVFLQPPLLVDFTSLDPFKALEISDHGSFLQKEKNPKKVGWAREY